MTHRYVARQLIVDHQGKPYAYELLYRNSTANFYPVGVAADKATQDMISALNVDFSTEELTGGRPAFLNFPREVLLSPAVEYLDPESYVIEVLEDVEIDQFVTERVADLKKKGYTLAVDDYTGEQNIAPIAPHVTIIKIDLPLTSPEKQREILAEFGETKLMLAEKIENEAEFQEALAMGYHLFQGYHFARPTLIIKESIGFNQASVLSLLRETQAEDVDFDKIEDIIQKDPGITYRLLIRGNTVQFAGSQKITNPAQVVVRMGMEGLQKWITLLLMQESAVEGQDEKMELALIRGHFAENLAREIDPSLDRNQRYFFYLVGMFSVFPEKNRQEVFDHLGFDESNQLEQKARQFLEFVYRYEVGDYDFVDQFLALQALSEEVLVKCYKSAIASAAQAMQGG